MTITHLQHVKAKAGRMTKNEICGSVHDAENLHTPTFIIGQIVYGVERFSLSEGIVIKTIRTLPVANVEEQMSGPKMSNEGLRARLVKAVDDRLAQVNFEPVGTGLYVSLWKSERDYLTEIVVDAVVAALSAEADR